MTFIITKSNILFSSILTMKSIVDIITVVVIMPYANGSLELDIPILSPDESKLHSLSPDKSK